MPIVPAAILYDLGFGGDPKIRPNADCGYRAASAAGNGAVQEGNIGAGAGATVGKMGGRRAPEPGGRPSPMKGGLGSAAIVLPNGLVVGALVAVNAVGDVIDPWSGQVVAGARNPDGTLADVRKLIAARRACAADRDRPKTQPSGSWQPTHGSPRNRPAAWR